MKPIVCVAMNRAFILFILSLFSFSIYAQNIRVESFGIVMNDATASASPVLDANDDPCALIRLVTTDKEYEIDGNIKRVEKTGELLFYVPSGTRQVTIRHSSLGFLNYSFEQRLQSKATYRMVLPSNTIVIHSEDRGGHYLVMRIVPANAVVHIDGMMENVRDGLLQKFLPYGMHTYRVEAPLYSMEEGSVEIGREKKQLDISLKPNFADVTLKAQGAEIKVNSESKGNGSWRGRLNPGTYLVETVKPGYRNATYTLVVVSGEDRSIDLPMPTPMYASLDVSSNAVNGSVYVDGKHIGNAPDIFKVLAGKHTVELRANGYESKSYTVELAEGEAKKLFAEIIIEESVLIPFFDSNKDKYGFIDISGKLHVKCKYSDAQPFSDGLAAVERGYHNWGFIDKTGKEVVECRYDEVGEFSNGLAPVKKDGKWGFIDKTGKELVECKYYKVEDFSGGLAAVEKYGKWGFIDKTGKEVIECKYYDVGNFSEGLARVCISNWGFIDKTGKEVVECKYYDVGNFSEGLAAVEIFGNWGFIDKTGKEVIERKYEYAFPFSGGLAAVEKYGKWGFIDKTGKELVKCKYYNVGYFSEGLARVCIRYGNWGFIDKTGKEVVECKYDKVEDFSDGFTKVKKDGYEFFIDRTGKEYIK